MNERAARCSPRRVVRATWILACVGVLGALCPRSASASSTYPPKIHAAWGVDEPACTLCHKTLDGGSGTVVKAFGRDAVTQFGLTGGSDVKLLANVLDAMKRAGTDSDGDGRSNYDELVAGTDPNDKKSFAMLPAQPMGGDGGAPSVLPGDGGAAGAESELPSCSPARTIFPTPEYGCNFKRGPESASGTFVAVCLLGLSSVSRKRRRQRSDARSN